MPIIKLSPKLGLHCHRTGTWAVGRYMNAPSVMKHGIMSGRRFMDYDKLDYDKLVEVALRIYWGKIGFDNPKDPDILALGEIFFPERKEYTRFEDLSDEDKRFAADGWLNFPDM